MQKSTAQIDGFWRLEKIKWSLKNIMLQIALILYQFILIWF